MPGNQVPKFPALLISERVVQLAEKRIKSVRSETRFQDTLLSVHELNLLCHGIKRDSFDKRELQIIVKKMMMKEYQSLISNKSLCGSQFSPVMMKE